MGSVNRRDIEEPVHRVFISEFEMARTPVTNAFYGLFLEATGAAPPPFTNEARFSHPDKPVVGISWFEARAYCRWLSRVTGMRVRLPTEAEREKASRGGLEGKLYPWGDDVEGGGHDRVDGPLDGPNVVASSSPNGYGLFNMADTVHEWCLDTYSEDFYQDSPYRDPVALKKGSSRRVARGGSWRHQIVVTPCPARSTLPPTFQYSDFGFRWIVPREGHSEIQHET
jgi:formylglycine-generating enzyme required for sulfatase activity